MENGINDYNKAFNYALNILERSNKTESEINLKLRSKQFSDLVINAVIERLKELDFINDERYIDNWLNLKKATQGFNKRLATNKLMQKGLDKELVKKKMEELTIDEYSLAKELAMKKARTLPEEDENKRAKILNFLIRKGYRYDIARKVINDVINAEEIGNEYE